MKARNLLFFNKGFEKLDKELDIANLVKNIRNSKYMLKIFFDKDQRRLLQLKNTKLVSSDDEKPNVFYTKKKLQKNKLINMYVDNLRSKRLTKTDLKLFEVTGFKKL